MPEIPLELRVSMGGGDRLLFNCLFTSLTLEYAITKSIDHAANDDPDLGLALDFNLDLNIFTNSAFATFTQAKPRHRKPSRDGSHSSCPAGSGLRRPGGWSEGA
ncbi:hypothetical protein EVAR_57879_1 [Eumeta japonica]|uniref:Uncharacterized protein n=1 Tax=Eumeta variegata TaxID=151549 RepID=A0A4C1ZGD6_EUMVA|nr:hypothetical protein EVAR_57879_1 [Eumeta japonica]